MAKNPQKLLKRMMILCIVIALAAIAVGVIAAYKEEYIITAAMLLVAAWQVVNYKKWKRSL